MATLEVPVEKWAARVREVALGATSAEGGTRGKALKVGGEATLPFLHFEGEIPNRPIIAVEVQDRYPSDWSPVLLEAWGDILKDPVAWAKKGVDLGADLVYVKLAGSNPEQADAHSPEEAAGIVKSILQAVDVPLIVYGPGNVEKDPELLIKVAQAAEGERLVIGAAEDKNYRTIVAGALAHGHVVAAFSPMDVNLAKQLNILICDVGLPADRIIIDPTTGALGYGIEYCISVIERLRLSALQGDGMMQMPVFCTVGEEAWRAKESKVGEDVPEAWGNFDERGILWEVTTATALLNAGAEIVSLRHPKSIGQVEAIIDQLMGKEK